MTIDPVTAADLGIYQCVLHRISDFEYSTVSDNLGVSMPTWSGFSTALDAEEEWVSASALLALRSDRVARSAEDLARLAPPSPLPITTPAIPEETTPELTPNATAFFDNLAVHLSWKLSPSTVISAYTRIGRSLSVQPGSSLTGNGPQSPNQSGRSGLEAVPEIGSDLAEESAFELTNIVRPENVVFRVEMSTRIWPPAQTMMMMMMMTTMVSPTNSLGFNESPMVASSSISSPDSLSTGVIRSGTETNGGNMAMSLLPYRGNGLVGLQD
ncbi:unnamed protein product [Protopolystoma xenopodis]|uniref:Uncharacterized protein n=1 Tax=Protopolystoma xenopodis TaxID=117903 RepID=A0A448XF68_9PLAT|nr:unnamed protein product [Protopolystoma xenopodis]